MTFLAVATPVIRIAAAAFIYTGASRAANGILDQLFPHANGSQLDDIQATLNGILGLLSEDGPPNTRTRRPGQCDAFYRINYHFEGVAGSGQIFSYDTFIEGRGPFGPLSFDPLPGAQIGWTLPYRVGFPDNGVLRIEDRGGGWNSADLTILSYVRYDGQPDNCGDEAIFHPTGTVNPSARDYPGDFGGRAGTTRFGDPYLDANGELRIPFRTQADDGSWALEGSVNAATGEVHYGIGVDVDGDGIPDYDPAFPPGAAGGDGGPVEPSDCVSKIVCAGDSWPITVPSLLSEENSVEENLENLPQSIVWFVKNLDAISGQYPIKIQIEDTDPLTNGDQSQTISLPNQAEAMAELFGLAYESNMNSELAVNMIFRMIPELIAAKNSSLITQDYAQALTNWSGFRTKAVARKIDSNFNPLRADSMADFLKASKYEVQGVEDDDPHTLVEWVQQIKYAVAIMKASVFRSPEQAENLLGEMKQVLDNGQPEDAGESWEAFIDALNRANSNLTDRNFHPRPRATAVDDVLNPGTVLPERGD